MNANKRGKKKTITQQLATEEEVKACLKKDSFQRGEFSETNADLVTAGAEQSVIKR